MTHSSTYLYLTTKYGLRLNTGQLAEVLGTSPGAIRVARCEDRFPVPMYREGNKCYADSRVVAEYIDRKHAEAGTVAPV